MWFGLPAWAKNKAMLPLLLELKLTTGPVSPTRISFSPSLCLRSPDELQFPMASLYETQPTGDSIRYRCGPSRLVASWLPLAHLFPIRWWSNLSSCDSLSSDSSWGNGPPLLSHQRTPSWKALHVLPAQVTSQHHLNSSDVWIALSNKNTKKTSSSIGSCWSPMQLPIPSPEAFESHREH